MNTSTTTTQGKMVTGLFNDRQSAERALVAMGAAAREAVRTATQSDDPEIASRARGVLVQLPWALPSDSPAAKQLLAGYGAAVPERRRIASELARLRPGRRKPRNVR